MYIYENYSLLTFDFRANASPEPPFFLCVSAFFLYSLIHTVVKVFQHGWLENNYSNCVQWA